MARNDTILLDGILENRLSQGLPSTDRAEVFEFLGFEQALKDFDLNKEEIESGWIDGRDDGGIDGFFIFVNGHQLRDPATFPWPRKNAEIEVRVFTCKHHETFKQAPVNSLLASVTELFDLAKDKQDLLGSYRTELLQLRDLLTGAYRRLSPTSPTLLIKYEYISRGDSAQVDTNIRARGDQVVELTRTLFSSSKVSFSFLGAAELVALHRRTKRFSLDLPIIESFSHGPSSYVVLARLGDYVEFVTSETGSLRRYLFDSNVRDFMTDSSVNQDIAGTLRDPTAPEFWWLNNGITVLATHATIVGKEIRLQDIQIVNGLQTTESVFAHFKDGVRTSEDRAVLLKIIVTNDPYCRDLIIRSTNNQNLVEHAALRATDKIQRDIEDHLERHGWFYERRKNYHKNVGKPAERFVTPLYLASGYVALILKHPAAAAKLKMRFMRNDDSYKMVFTDDAPLGVWLGIVTILKACDQTLMSSRFASSPSDRAGGKWRSLLSFITAGRLFGTYDFSAADVVDRGCAAVPPSLVAEVWELIVEVVAREKYPKATGKSFALVMGVCEDAAEHFGIGGCNVIARRKCGALAVPPSKTSRKDREIPSDLVERINAALPTQPWKPGTVAIVAQTVDCSRRDVTDAIRILIREKRRNRQENGVVFDGDGTIIAVDPERVPTGEGKQDRSST